MAVMISEDKKDLIVTCKCGCDEGVHLHISHEGDEDYYLNFPSINHRTSLG